MVDFDEKIIDIAWKNIEAEDEWHSSLDKKTLALITLTFGLLIAFLRESNPTSGVHDHIFLYFTSIFFLITIYMSFSVIRIENEGILSSEILFSELKQKEPDAQIKGLVDTFVAMDTKKSNLCNEKAKKYRYTYLYLLLTGFIFIMLYGGSSLE